MRYVSTAVILALALVAGVLAGRPLATGVAPAGAATTGHLTYVTMDEDAFYNYDFNSITGDPLATNVDWPIDLLFWNNASVASVTSLYRPGYPYSGSSQYALLADDKNAEGDDVSDWNWSWDGDAGVKDRFCPSYNTRARHMRLYAPGGGQLYNINWGYYVLATTHTDFQECWFGTQYGWSEDTEHIFAGYARDHGYTVAEDAPNLDFGNSEAPHWEGNHYWQNDGHASAVNVPGVGTVVHDVAVTSLGAPAEAAAGTPVTVPVTVRNAGNQAEAISVGFTDNGAAVGTAQSVWLAPTGSATLDFTWQPASAGTHTLVATASIAGTDASPGDNSATATVPVTGASHDVAVTDLVVPASVGPGQTAPVTVTAANLGDVAETVTVKLTATAGSVGPPAQQTIALAPGGSGTVSFTWTADGTTIPGGSYTLTATAKVDGDANAANDSLMQTIKVSSPTLHVQDLALSSARVAKSYQINGSVTIADGGGPVPGATAQLQLTGPRTSVTFSVSTGTNGVATFSRTVRYTGTYTVTVLNVAASGYTYDPSLNVVTQRSITVR